MLHYVSCYDGSFGRVSTATSPSWQTGVKPISDLHSARVSYYTSLIYDYAYVLFYSYAYAFINISSYHASAHGLESVTLPIILEFPFITYLSLIYEEEFVYCCAFI